MSKPPLLYAKLPQFKYQTFDLETLKFSDVPVIPIYENVGTVGDDKVNADIESNKDKGPDDPSEPVPELSNDVAEEEGEVKEEVEKPEEEASEETFSQDGTEGKNEEPSTEDGEGCKQDQIEQGETEIEVVASEDATPPADEVPENVEPEVSEPGESQGPDPLTESPPDNLEACDNEGDINFDSVGSAMLTSVQELRFPDVDPEAEVARVKAEKEAEAELYHDGDYDDENIALSHSPDNTSEPVNEIYKKDETIANEPDSPDAEASKLDDYVQADENDAEALEGESPTEVVSPEPEAQDKLEEYPVEEQAAEKLSPAEPPTETLPEESPTEELAEDQPFEDSPAEEPTANDPVDVPASVEEPKDDGHGDEEPTLSEETPTERAPAETTCLAEAESTGDPITEELAVEDITEENPVLEEPAPEDPPEDVHVVDPPAEEPSVEGADAEDPPHEDPAPEEPILENRPTQELIVEEPVAEEPAQVEDTLVPDASPKQPMPELNVSEESPLPETSVPDQIPVEDIPPDQPTADRSIDEIGNDNVHENFIIDSPAGESAEAAASLKTRRRKRRHRSQWEHGRRESKSSSDSYVLHRQERERAAFANPKWEVLGEVKKQRSPRRSSDEERAERHRRANRRHSEGRARRDSATKDSFDTSRHSGSSQSRRESTSFSLSTITSKPVALLKLMASGESETNGPLLKLNVTEQYERRLSTSRPSDSSSSSRPHSNSRHKHRHHGEKEPRSRENTSPRDSLDDADTGKRRREHRRSRRAEDLVEEKPQRRDSHYEGRRRERRDSDRYRDNGPLDKLKDRFMVNLRTVLAAAG
ncbi:conserved hypothetical protein [Histoplasma capsulatum var. duboisii H88]|uniref:Uncharacterized protein n=1 Tax=Ajellomyces capsulatus (strain H88) TaxID=544711 RepID=F0U524_AJEC8|nr:conserved hypothetical protein [Histoplasma capsulatum var. duboisii H88]